MLPFDGVVLAGGESRRMGRSKADLPIAAGATLLDNAVAVLHGACDGTIWISRAADHHPCAWNDIPDRPGTRGPLAGIDAGLSHTRHALLLVLAVDLPMIPSALFLQLYQAWLRQPDTDVIYAGIADGPEQPLAGLWHQRTHPVIADLLVSPHTPSVQAVLRRVTTQRIAPARADWLLNVNTPDDWMRFKAQGSL